MNEKTTLIMTSAFSAILFVPFTWAQNLDVEEMLDELEEDMVEIPGTDYFISKYEVTQALWEAVMGELPGDYRPKEKNPKFPVGNIDVERAESFVEKLNSIEQIRESGLTYRLPTSDEWLYACRAGATNNCYCKAEDGRDITIEELQEVAWYRENCSGIQPVGEKRANAFGLYDMLGNVREMTCSFPSGLGEERKTPMDHLTLRHVMGKDFSGNFGGWIHKYNGDILSDFYDSSLYGSSVGLRLLAEKTEKLDVRRKEALAKLDADMVSIPGKKYAVCKYEVTQELWEIVTGQRIDGVGPSVFKGADLPVHDLFASECEMFIEKLNALPEVQSSGSPYRFLEEREWVFACSAGASGPYCKLTNGTEVTKENSLVNAVAWYRGNSEERIKRDPFSVHRSDDWITVKTPHPVGKRKPNAFGLYDMFGNVWEWIRGESGRLTTIGGDIYSSQGDFDLGQRVNYLNSPGHTMMKGLRLGRGPVATADEFTEVKLNAMEEKVEAELVAADDKAEADRKAMEEAAKDITKLSAVMVSIPGKKYSICKFEVTQALWTAVMGENPSKFKGEDLPVENISWNDCQFFLEKLNALPAVKASRRKYRLPTKKEWEFACSAGSTGEYCKLADGKEITRETLDEVAWFSENSQYQTHPVGQKKPNAFGLYDMLGNVWEWTSTDFGKFKIFCGGAYNLGTRISFMLGGNEGGRPESRNGSCGFRLAW